MQNLTSYRCIFIVYSFCIYIYTLVDYRWSGQLITSLKRLVNHLQISNLHLLGHVQAVSTMRTSIYGATGHAMSLRTILIWWVTVVCCCFFFRTTRKYAYILLTNHMYPTTSYYTNCWIQKHPEIIYLSGMNRDVNSYLCGWFEKFWGVLVGPGWTGLGITQQVPRVPRLEAKSDALQHVSRDVCISSFHLGREKKHVEHTIWCPKVMCVSL